MVLLKNEDNILPLKKEGNIAIIGAFAKTPRYQGGGSSHINPTKLDNVLEELKKSAGSNSEISYSEGFSLISDEYDENLVDQAIIAAAKSQVTVIFAGLPDRYESEGYDRKHMRIPENQINLIKEIVKVQDNIVVVLSNGSPIEMPWLDKVKGVLEGYLGGQAAGGALADLLFGDFNPCGKLAETFPVKLSDNPSYLNFPGEGDIVEYKEGLFVGYRYYDKKELITLFPFGHGLSYTSFEYSDIILDKKEMDDNDTLKVQVKIKNTGKVSGKEIVQLYVVDVESTVIRPNKELKAFEKVELKPGEGKIVSFILDKRAFAYYNVEINDWHVESGDFEILVGASSKDIRTKEMLHINSTVVIKKKFSRNSTIGDIMSDPNGAETAKGLKKDIFGEEDNAGDGIGTDRSAMFNDFVLRSMVIFSGDKFTEEMMESLLEKLNSDKVI